MTIVWKFFSWAGDIRLKGLFFGLHLVKNRETREPATEEAQKMLYLLIKVGRPERVVNAHYNARATVNTVRSDLIGIPCFSDVPDALAANGGKYRSESLTGQDPVRIWFTLPKPSLYFTQNNIFLLFNYCFAKILHGRNLIYWKCRCIPNTQLCIPSCLFSSQYYLALSLNPPHGNPLVLAFRPPLPLSLRIGGVIPWIWRRTLWSDNACPLPNLSSPILVTT